MSSLAWDGARLLGLAACFRHSTFDLCPLLRLSAPLLQRVAQQMKDAFDIEPSECLKVSAKTGVCLCFLAAAAAAPSFKASSQS